jgi:hypothetical protein
MEAGHNGGLNGKGDILLPYFIADFPLAPCASSLNISYHVQPLLHWLPVHSELEISLQFWVL